MKTIILANSKDSTDSKYSAVGLLCLLIGFVAAAFIMSSSSSSRAQSLQSSVLPQETPTPINISPTATAKAFYDAVVAKDVQGIKDTMSKGSLEMMAKFAELQGKTLDEALRAPSASRPPPAFESRNERITDDTATLEVKDEKDQWDTLPFVKEDGQWKFALDKAVQQGASANGTP